ncbi:restriction endonuclease subunit S [Bacillus paranthracis]
MNLLENTLQVFELKDLLSRISKPVEVEKAETYTQIGIRSHGKGIFVKEPVTGESLGNKRVFWIEPDCLIVNIVFAWERAVSKTTSDLNGLIASHRFPMYKTKKNVNLDYLMHYLLTPKGKKLLEDASPGGAGRNKTLSQKDFMESKIQLPSLEVQKYISSFLEIIEKKIQLQQQKIDLLQEQKKGYMQKIFKQELRFKDADGKDYPEWEIRSVEEIALVSKGYTPDTKETSYWDDNLKNWLSIAGMKEKYIAEGNKGVTSIGELKHNRVEANTLIMSFKLTIGKLAIIKKAYFY